MSPGHGRTHAGGPGAGARRWPARACWPGRRGRRLDGARVWVSAARAHERRRGDAGETALLQGAGSRKRGAYRKAPQRGGRRRGGRRSGERPRGRTSTAVRAQPRAMRGGVCPSDLASTNSCRTSTGPLSTCTAHRPTRAGVCRKGARPPDQLRTRKAAKQGCAPLDTPPEQGLIHAATPTTFKNDDQPRL